MPHVAICGKSQSGKTTRMKLYATEAIAQGRRVIYCTSKSREREAFPCHWRTTDPFAAMHVLKHNQNMTAFFDECWEYLTYEASQRPLLWLTNTARGEGHQCVFGSQDFKQVNIAYRKNLDRLFLYRADAGVPEQWAADLGAPVLLKALSIPQYHCLHWRDGFGPDGQPKPVLFLKPCKVV